jgi:hypothetical protein
MHTRDSLRSAATKVVLSAVIAISFTITSCQTAVDVNVELPYEEKIVVRGLLVAGEPLTNVQISRTLPPLEVFTYEKVLVTDAEVLVRSERTDGTNVRLDTLTLLPLRQPTQNQPVRSLYGKPSVRVEAGRRYVLTVRWRGSGNRVLVARAETRVPEPPQVITTRFQVAITQRSVGVPNAPMLFTTDTTLTVSAVLRPQAIALQSPQMDVFRIGAQFIDSGRIVRAERSQADVITPTDSFARQADGTLLLRTADWTRVPPTIWQAWQQGRVRTLELWAIVQSYDEDYYRYYQTRNRGGQPDGFSPGGPNVEWNVTGDGVGAWIGSAAVRVRVER